MNRLQLENLFVLTDNSNQRDWTGDEPIGKPIQAAIKQTKLEIGADRLKVIQVSG
jgi:hypothetical protein